MNLSINMPKTYLIIKNILMLHQNSMCLEITKTQKRCTMSVYIKKLFSIMKKEIILVQRQNFRELEIIKTLKNVLLNVIICRQLTILKTSSPEMITAL